MGELVLFFMIVDFLWCEIFEVGNYNFGLIDEWWIIILLFELYFFIWGIGRFEIK